LIQKKLFLSKKINYVLLEDINLKLNFVELVFYLDHLGFLIVKNVIVVLKNLIIIVLGLEIVLGKIIINIF
jgi:hypothetical protein